MSTSDSTNSREHRKGLALGAPVAILLTFLMVGCYTILQHPITADEGPDRTAHHQEYYRQQCIDCHADYAEFPYGFFYSDYPNYYFENPRWGYYYAYPWWWDHYWYDNDGSVTDEVREGSTSSSRADRRGALAPPYVGGSPALPTGGGSYSAPGSQGTKGGTSTTVPAEPTAPGEKIRVKKADTTEEGQDGDKEKKGKASRRGGVDPGQ